MFQAGCQLVNPLQCMLFKIIDLIFKHFLLTGVNQAIQVNDILQLGFQFVHVVFHEVRKSQFRIFEFFSALGVEFYKRMKDFIQMKIQESSDGKRCIEGLTANKRDLPLHVS